MIIASLIKKGKNVKIEINNNETGFSQNFFEDSSNVELIYNPYSNKVTINIKGTASITTAPVDNLDVDVLEMGNETTTTYVRNYPAFIDAYALVFPNGGGGPVTTPTLQDVLNQGTNADYQNGNADINLFDRNSSANYITPYGNEIADGNNNRHLVQNSNGLELTDYNSGASINNSLDLAGVNVQDTKLSTIYQATEISVTQKSNNKVLNISYPAPLSNDQNISFPNDSGELQIKKIKTIQGVWVLQGASDIITYNTINEVGINPNWQRFDVGFWIWEIPYSVCNIGALISLSFSTDFYVDNLGNPDILSFIWNAYNTGTSIGLSINTRRNSTGDGVDQLPRQGGNYKLEIRSL